MSALSRANSAITSTCNLLVKPVTLSLFVIDEQKRSQQSPDDLSLLFYSIQSVARVIAAAIKSTIADPVAPMTSAKSKSSIHRFEDNIRRISSSVHDLFVESIRSTRAACMVISQFNHEPIEVDLKHKYILCFQALDNIGNIESQIPLGSVFSIYRKPGQGKPSAKDILQPARNSLVAAGYVLYGSATVIVMSMGNGVHGFTLDSNNGEFFLTDPDIRIIPRGHIYSVNEGTMYQWESPVAEYVEKKKGYKTGKPYRSLHIDSLTADVHRILKQGGIYINPTTKDFPLGKLELIYEGIPMAFLLEQAGGLASNGKTPILDIIPNTLDEKVAVAMGSREDVRDLLLCYRRDSVDNSS